MRKHIHSDSFNWGADIDRLSNILDVSSRGIDTAALRKSAAVLTKEIADIRPEKGKTHIHLIAMGAGESIGPNKNADWFGKSALVRKHSTFVTRGLVYKHHKCSDPSLSSGAIKASAYNPDMDRVELVIAVDNDKWGGELQKLASGQDLTFSMSCDIDYDQCMVCGNKAANRSQYCACMKKAAGRMTDDGRIICVDNPNPSFFDISYVVRPADRIAYSLQKVASCSGPVVTGADLYALSLPDAVRVTSYCTASKRATLDKLAKIEKQIELCASPEINDNICQCFSRSCIPDSAAEVLKNFGQRDMPSLLTSLADQDISLSLPDFSKIVLNRSDLDASAVMDELPGVFQDMLEDDAAGSDGAYDLRDAADADRTPENVKKVIIAIMPTSSLSPDAVEKRASLLAAHGVKSGEFRLRPLFKSAGVAERTAAREYAEYKLSLLSARPGINRNIAVLQNYIV